MYNKKPICKSMIIDTEYVNHYQLLEIMTNISIQHDITTITRTTELVPKNSYESEKARYIITFVKKD